MFDSLFLLFAVAVFVAVALAIEAGYTWWNSTRGPEAQRMAKRLRAISAGGHGSEHASMLKQRLLSESPTLERLLLLLPRVGRIDRMLIESGSSMSVAELAGSSLLLFVLGVTASMVRGLPSLIGLLFAAFLGALPTMHVMRKASKRLATLDKQLPDCIDLMGRALRAGHAFPTALKMVGDEMPDPIGAEFRIVFDEINFGVAVQDAMLNLASRVPSDDLRYLVVAVLIQRETGGNLAELLDKIAGIVRSRQTLMGEIRTLSAEGRLSAWILSGLPFAAGLVINIVNPGFMAVLWHDPVGIRLVWGAALMMAFGIWWMSRIIKIRV